MRRSFLILLLAAGAAPARAQSIQGSVTLGPVLGPVSPGLAVAGRGPALAGTLPSFTPSLGLSLTPALVGGTPAAFVPFARAFRPTAEPAGFVPEAAADAPATTLSGLSAWHAGASDGGRIRAESLGSLWDRRRPSPAAVLGVDAPTPALVHPSLEPSGVIPLPQSEHVRAVPGSIFRYRPVEDSPGHGLGFLDALIRRALARKDGRFSEGFTFPGAEDREHAEVFLYGERHTDKALIAENFRRLVSDLRPGKGAVVLDEGYFGPTLFGSDAVGYLETRGLDPATLPPGVDLEVRGWDEKAAYDASRHSTLQHTVNLYEFNQLLYSPQRGLGYYAAVARLAWTTFKNWLVVRRLAIDARNATLDASVKDEAERAAADGKTLHVIAGAEHLVARPLLSGLPGRRERLRGGLARALRGRRHWTHKPADTPEP